MGWDAGGPWGARAMLTVVIAACSLARAQFKAFLTCTLKHDEYYEPFLEMLNLGGDAGAAAAEGGGDVEDQQQEASAQRSSTGGGSQHGGQQQQQHHHQRSSSSGGIGAAAG